MVPLSMWLEIVSGIIWSRHTSTVPRETHSILSNRRIRTSGERHISNTDDDNMSPAPSIRRFLFVSQIFLISKSYSRSLSSDGQNLNPRTTARPAEVMPHREKEFANYVDGECPMTKNMKLNNINNCKNLCTADADCEHYNKCCQIGCGFTCVEPWFPKQVVDWVNSPSNEVYGNEILEEKLSGPLGGEPCSTSILSGMEPLKCPADHVCLIKTDEYLQLNIPNRGECVVKNHQGISKIDRGSEFKGDSQNTECLYKGKKYKHEEKFRKGCNTCVCYSGVIFCGIKSCRVRIGIPATAPRATESDHIHIDSDNHATLDEENYDEEEEEEESGSARNEFDDEESGSPPKNVVEEDTQTHFKEKDSVLKKKIIQSTTAPSMNQENMTSGDSNQPTKDESGKYSFESIREKLPSNSSGISQSSIKIKATDVSTEKPLLSKTEIVGEGNTSDDKAEKSLYVKEKHDGKKSTSLMMTEMKLKNVELTAIEHDLGSAGQEDLEGSGSGSGYDKNDSEERKSEGSVSDTGSMSRKREPSDVIDTVVLQHWASGGGMTELKAQEDETNKENKKVLSDQEGSTPRHVRGLRKSSEYLETTDDEQ